MYYISEDENKFKLLIYQRERKRGKKKRYRPKLLLLFIITLFTEGNFPLSKLYSIQTVHYIIRLAKTRLTNNLRNQYIMYKCNVIYFSYNLK